MPLHPWSLQTLPTLPKEETAPQISRCVPPSGSPVFPADTRLAFLGSTCRPRATLPGDERSSTFGPSLLASRGDPDRRLTAWVPPCSRSVQGNGARIAPRLPRPPPAEGPRRFRQCRSGPTRAAQREAEEGTDSRGRRNLLCKRPWCIPATSSSEGPSSPFSPSRLRAPDDRTSANGWRRLGAQPPGGEFRHRCFLPDGIMVREVSEDGWGGRRGRLRGRGRTCVLFIVPLPEPSWDGSDFVAKGKGDRYNPDAFVERPHRRRERCRPRLARSR